MFINNCPKNSAYCLARFLGRFAFQPMKENPLLGPSSLTWVTLKISTLFLKIPHLIEIRVSEFEMWKLFLFLMIGFVKIMMGS